MKAVFFDFDGVLTTDKTGSASIVNHIAGQTGVNRAEFQAAYARRNRELLYGGQTHRDVWDGICGDIGADISYDALFESFIRTPIDWEMVRLAEKCKRAGARIGMITDNKRDRIDAVMAYHNWYGLFDAVIVSADVGSGKGGADIFRAALRAVGAKAEDCMFIDNAERNLIAPGEMGFLTVHFDDIARPIDALSRELERFLAVGDAPRIALRLPDAADLPALEQIDRECGEYFRFDPPCEMNHDCSLEECLTAGDVPSGMRREDFRRENYFFYCVWLGGELIGFLSYYLGYLREDAAYLSVLYIKQAHRAGGIGAEVLREFVRRMAAERIGTVRLHCSLRNATALRFWVRNGFDRVVAVECDGNLVEGKFGGIELMRDINTNPNPKTHS